MPFEGKAPPKNHKTYIARFAELTKSLIAVLNIAILPLIYHQSLIEPSLYVLLSSVKNFIGLHAGVINLSGWLSLGVYLPMVNEAAEAEKNKANQAFKGSCPSELILSSKFYWL